eukprot:CAMPEP_0203752402 /NCGR_PEP_ID=MMETSP0098-20131031/6342_1 /ASSEMBLY_ACC=CAM_ASM_000208 /TAXON_ID=96639 /ORGANISM=" , Strain NY0313808BC1" /LENGTH=281 /DNA_ID=CAMNT_0050642555 /DNA_START=846 /DNA_END=1688 /DNA_ORIENTATION=-
MILYPLTKDEIKTRIILMLERELKYEIVGDYIDLVQVDGMRPVWRTRLFEWLFEFVDEFCINIVTVATAMNFVDRYLQKVSTKKCILQLVALAAILIATKLYETRPVGIGELQGLAEGLYLDSDIRLMELELLRVLSWELNPVTPYCFLRYLIVYFDNVDNTLRERVLSFATTFVEIVLCEYAFVRFLPSECATAALLCAFDLCNLNCSAISNELWKAGLVDCERVMDCKAILERFLQEVSPEFFRSKIVVSPDCVDNLPSETDSSTCEAEFFSTCSGSYR